MKKILAIVLVVVLIVGGLPLNIFAVSNSGTCGDNATWSYDENTKTLTISGKGAIDNYTRKYYDLNGDTYYHTTAPWAHLEKEAEYLVIENGITAVGNHSFYSFLALTTVNLPNTLKSINDYAFHCCYELQKIVFPDSLETIGYKAFDGCHGLKNISINANIDIEAFHWCLNLQEVIIAEGVKSINSYAFNNCTILNSIYIPSSVTSIGAYAFCRDKVVNTNKYWAYSGYEGLVIYGEAGSYAESYCKSKGITFVEYELSNTGNGFEYPIYNEDKYAKMLEAWINTSDLKDSFTPLLENRSYVELLKMTINTPLFSEDTGYAIEGDTQVKDIMAYIMFANNANSYIANEISNVRNNMYKKSYDAYTDFLDCAKTFNYQYNFFQEKLNGRDSFKNGIMSLRLASAGIALADKTPIIKNYKYITNLYKLTITEQPKYYDNLMYYVLMGGDDKYLNQGYSQATKDVKQAVKFSGKIINSTNMPTSNIPFGLENLSYFSDTYNLGSSETIKTVKKTWDTASKATNIVKAMCSYNILGVVSGTWNLTNEYIEQVKKVYDKSVSVDAGWYALAYYYLGKENPNFFNAIFDSETGSAVWSWERLVQYPYTSDSSDIIQKYIHIYWEHNSAYEFEYAPDLDFRMYLWNTCNTMIAVGEINEAEYREMLLKYILAELNMENGDVGVKANITINSSDSSLGEVTKDKEEYYFGDNITVSAIPHSNSAFIAWKDAETGDIISTELSCDFKVTNDINIVAEFEKMVEDHTHSYSIIVTSPTCSNEGYTTYNCSCGDSFTSNYKSAVGHNYNTVNVIKYPSCIEKGERKITCADCGDCYTEELLSLGHIYNDSFSIDSLPTANALGTISHHCIMCDEKIDIQNLLYLSVYDRNLNLKNNLSLNYTVNKQAITDSKYENIYLKITSAKGETVLTDYTENGEKLIYSFKCTDLSQPIRATLFGYVDDILIEGESVIYGENESYKKDCDFNNDGIFNDFDCELLNKLLKQIPYKEVCDVNDDRSSDIRDLLRMKKIFSSADYNMTTDINEDGVIDNKDIAFMREYMVTYNSKYAS